MVARFKHNDITESSIDLLIMAVISGRRRATHFFKSQMGSGSELHDLSGGLVIISLTSTSEAGRNISKIIWIQGDIAGSIWRIKQLPYS